MIGFKSFRCWTNDWGEEDEGKKTFVLAEYHPWEASLAWSVFRHGQVIIHLNKKCRENTECRENTAKFLGENDIKKKTRLIDLIDFISQVMKRSINSCEKVYLISMGEGESLGLHFHLLPRCENDVEKGKEKEGYFFMHDWVREYNQNHLKYLNGDCKKKISNFIPPPKPYTTKHPWYDYAIQYHRIFQKGYDCLSEKLKRRWPHKSK